ncbi:MAG: hypothetical protein HZA84_04460 [Thaumarchaeota archaeon]|nr:hypothetical protein [Nitrososphaerota archaeon]
MTLKQLQTRNKLLSYAIPTLLMTVPGLIISPAFATSSVAIPYWSIIQDVQDTADPCSGASNSCADANANGINYLIARSYWGFGIDTHTATVRNNGSVSPDSIASSPQLTSSASTVKFKSDIVANGYIEYAGGQDQSIIYIDYGVDVWKNSGGTYTKIKTVKNLYATEGPVNINTRLTYSHPNSGSNTYRTNGIIGVAAQNNLITGTSYIDFWNGAYHADINRLEICDGC